MTGDDGMAMLGLHRLAAPNGDGLIPELFALLTRERRLMAENPNVTTFPVWETRAPARDIPFAASDRRPETSGTVIAFPRGIETAGRRKGSA